MSLQSCSKAMLNPSRLRESFPNCYEESDWPRHWGEALTAKRPAPLGAEKGFRCQPARCGARAWAIREPKWPPWDPFGAAKCKFAV